MKNNTSQRRSERVGFLFPGLELPEKGTQHLVYYRQWGILFFLRFHN